MKRKEHISSMASRNKDYFVSRLLIGEVEKIPARFFDSTLLEEDIANAHVLASNAYSKANSAQTAANSAQTTAETAQTTAETAQTAAETAKSIANKCSTRVSYALPNAVTLKFDKSKATNDNYMFTLGSPYYWMSDIALASASVKSFVATTQVGTATTTRTEGTNCTVYGQFIVIYEAGEFSYTNSNNQQLSETVTKPGVYAAYNSSSLAQEYNANSLTLVLDDNEVITELYLLSTDSLKKKFKITVNDSGELKATEVT